MTDDLGLLERRQVAVAWLEWATRRGSVAQTDPRYQQVVEGRDKPTRRYSSCGDLAHWMLFRLGVRLPWINRAEHTGWHVGRNVSALCWPPAPAVDSVTRPLDGGDVAVIWSRPDGTDAHVICVIEHDPGARVLCCAEYGQPGGALRNHVYTLDDKGRIKIGRRAIRRALRLEDVLDQAEHAGALVAYDEPLDGGA